MVVLQDPSVDSASLIQIDRETLERAWTGRIVLGKRSYALTDAQQPFGLGLVASFILRERRVVKDVTIAAVMLSILALVPILFWRLMTDRVLQYHAVSTFWVLTLMLIVLILFEVGFSWLRRYLIVGLTTRVDIRLSIYMFEKCSLYQSSTLRLLRQATPYTKWVRSAESGDFCWGNYSELCLMLEF